MHVLYKILSRSAFWKTNIKPSCCSSLILKQTIRLDIQGLYEQTYLENRTEVEFFFRDLPALKVTKTSVRGKFWARKSLRSLVRHRKFLGFHYIAPFNNMRTLTFKAQPTNAFFATVNQMSGGSS